MTTLYVKRDDLVAALKAKLPRAKQYDTDIVRQHRIAERDHLETFRAKCREAAKWDYETAKKHYFNIDRDYGPDCPKLMAVSIERALQRLALDTRAKFTLDPKGRDGDLYTLVTWDPDAPALEAC